VPAAFNRKPKHLVAGWASSHPRLSTFSKPGAAIHHLVEITLSTWRLAVLIWRATALLGDQPKKLFFLSPGAPTTPRVLGGVGPPLSPPPKKPGGGKIFFLSLSQNPKSDSSLGELHRAAFVSMVWGQAGGKTLAPALV